MSNEWGDKVGRLLEEARKVPPDERPAFLDQVGEDEALRREVASLVRACEEAPAFFERVAGLGVAPLLSTPQEEAGEPGASDPLDLEEEQVGRYAVQEHLGGGGMGVVYKARDTRLDRTVALKFLPPHLSTDEDAKRRFRREAKAASALDHLNIATIYEIGETEVGRLFIAMAYYEGETLKEKIAQGPLPVEEAVDYAQQVAAGLEKAHDAGIIHRDIKPANVVVTEDDVSKIVDFGLAKVVGVELTRTGTTPGTAAYMSPEQAKGDPVDRRTDLWSLGVTLYEMLAGERPFEGPQKHSLTYNIVHEDPKPVTRLGSESPAKLETVVHRMLAKVPDDRFPDAATVKANLKSVQRLLTGTDERTSPASGPTAALGVGMYSVIGPMVILGLLGLGVLVLVLQLNEPDSQLATVRPVTSHVGVEWAPAWAPDGSQIAYSFVNEGTADIAVLSPGGGDPHVIASSPHDEVHPRWSPDGSKIAFMADRGTGTNVYWVPPTGGAERKIVETHIPSLEHATGLFYSMGMRPWSPDGQELLFSRLQSSGNLAIWKVDIGTGRETQVTFPPSDVDDLAASFSFDGTQIVFERKGALWLLSENEGEPRPLLDDNHYNFLPSWGPEGDRVVFTSDRTGFYSLWELELESGKLTQLTTGPGNAMWAAISSERQLAYTSFDHQLDLYSIGVDPNETDLPQERLTARTGDNYGARVSPNGDRIVYYSNRSGNYEIWLHDETIGSDWRLTDHPDKDLTPDWSPDGEKVIFYSNREGTMQLWAVDPEGGPPRKLTDRRVLLLEPGGTIVHFGGPRWSPDGQTIGFIASTDEGGRTLWLVDPDGNSPRPSGLQGVLRFAWYRDSNHVIYTRHASDERSTYELRVADLETGEEASLLSGMHAEVTVAPDGHAVAYVQAESHFNMNLHALPLTEPDEGRGLPRPAGPPRQLTDGEGIWHVHNGGWSPDGEAIVYTRDEDWGDIHVGEYEY